MCPLPAAVLLTGLVPASVLAQEEGEQQEGSAAALLEEVVVTSRKREENLQDVPISVSAFNADQIEALKVRDLTNLSINMPNVALDDVGTFRSVANFSIRGLGINSSIPSIDPTVGVFVDGVYLGQNLGVVIDIFDIESIEVLRGPQGTLFGRNVTGGAVLINSKGPTDQLEVAARVAVDGNPNGDGGLNYYAMASVSGPLGDRVGGRLSVYLNDDQGWFENLATGEDHGEAETVIFRPVLTFNPTDDLELTFRWEHLESNGDGPAGQNHPNGRGIPGFFASFERDSFDFAIDEPGFYDFTNDLVTIQLDWDVPFGDGTITNIFGWKDYSATALSDIDSQPVWLFHAPAWNNQEQYSNELRYTGSFDRAQVTTGIFWFTNDIEYHERRELLGIATGGVAPGQTQDGGGLYEVDSIAWFGEVDYDLTDAWTLIGGLRYTKEDKSAQIASLVRNVDSPCNVVVSNDCPFDFVDSDTWRAWSGKAGFIYHMGTDRRVYGHWSRSQRSGGYNLRNTAIDTVNLGPGPFDEETVDNFELGFKTELGGRGRLNIALFYMDIADMQREVNLADPISGVVQVIKNTADARIWGTELDAVYAVGDNTVLRGSIGWIDPEYTEVRFDLNGDGVIDAADEALDLPRAAELTWSLGVTSDFAIGDTGYLTLRADYAFRDDAAYTDNNLGFFLSQDYLTAGIDLTTGSWVVSLYGRNLLNEVNHGGDTQLPAVLGPLPAGGTFSPLMKGRVVGLEVGYNYRQ